MIFKHFNKMALLSLISLFFFLMLPGYEANAHQCPQKDHDKLCPQGEILYLASFSIPDSSFKTVIKEAFLRKGRTRIIFRGLPEDENKKIMNLKEFSQRFKPLVDEVIEEIKNLKLDAPGKLRFAIDPRVFDAFKIESVPAIIFCGKKPRMVIGDVSLEMARIYLNKFTEKTKVFYGPEYYIKETDIRLVASNLFNNIFTSKDFNKKAKEVAQKARKKFLTGYKLPLAKNYSIKKYNLVDLILKEKSRMIKEFKTAFETDNIPPEVKKVLDNITPEKAKDLAQKITLTQAGEEIIMADADDPEQVKYALQRLKKNNRAVALFAGNMEKYYWKYYPKIYPLKKYQVEKWNITGLPARLFLNKKGEVILEEGQRKNGK